MQTLSTRFVAKVQEWKSKKLEPLGLFLSQHHLSANFLTILSLLCGLLAVYFLFVNTFLFMLFIVLHLLFDMIDGVVARAAKPTFLGAFLDHILSDGLVTVLPILKIGFFLSDVYAYATALLFACALVFYAISRFQAPILFMRMYVVIGLFLSVSITSYTPFLLTILYLSVAVAGGYSLARQLQWFLQKKDFNM